MKNNSQSTTLGEIAKIGAGNSAPQDKTLFSDGLFPFFRTSDVGQVRFGLIDESRDYLNESGIKGLRQFPKGTILVPKSGASTFLNHRVMLDVDGYVSSHLATINANPDKVIAKYLLYFLSTIAAQDLIQDHSYPSLNLPMLSNIPIELPPLADQKRIVAKLDEAFAAIAKAKENAEKNVANARAIFESELSTIFAKTKEGWEDRQLLTLCHEVTVGYVGPMAREYKSGGVPFLRSQNIRPFYVDLDNVKFIDRTFHSKLNKSRLRPGDLAIVRTGYPGTAAVIPPELSDANCSDLVIVRPKADEVSPYFLEAFFNSEFGRKTVLGNLVGAAQKHFNVTAAKEVVLHLPPREEQERINTKVREINDETQRFASKYERKIIEIEALRSSLLHHAFIGQL